MRLPVPLWAFPRRWRERYADEVRETFGRSSRPLSDWIDLVRIGLLTRLEEHVRSLLTIGLTAAAGVALIVIGYTLAELRDGVWEVHRHWWSTAPVAAFASSCAALLWIRWDSTARGTPAA